VGFDGRFAEAGPRLTIASLGAKIYRAGTGTSRDTLILSLLYGMGLINDL
jgi:hypothetical protein